MSYTPGKVPSRIVAGQNLRAGELESIYRFVRNAKGVGCKVRVDGDGGLLVDVAEVATANSINWSAFPFGATVGGVSEDATPATITIHKGLYRFYGRMAAPVEVTAEINITGGTQGEPHYLVLLIQKGSYGTWQIVERTEKSNPNNPAFIEVDLCQVYLRDETHAVIARRYQTSNILLGLPM